MDVFGGKVDQLRPPAEWGCQERPNSSVRIVDVSVVADPPATPKQRNKSERIDDAGTNSDCQKGN